MEVIFLSTNDDRECEYQREEIKNNSKQKQNKTNSNKNHTHKPVALHRKCETDDISVYNKQLYRIISQIQKDFCPVGPRKELIWHQ